MAHPRGTGEQEQKESGQVRSSFAALAFGDITVNGDVTIGAHAWSDDVSVDAFAAFDLAAMGDVWVQDYDIVTHASVAGGEGADVRHTAEAVVDFFSFESSSFVSSEP